MSKIKCPICGAKNKIKYYKTVYDEKFICQKCNNSFSFYDILYYGRNNDVSGALKEISEALDRLFWEIIYSSKIDKLVEWINGKIKKKKEKGKRK